MKNINFKKTIKRFVIWSTVLSILSIFIIDIWVKTFASDKCFYDLKNIPTKKVALLLGTSKTLGNGNDNLYYNYRIDAVVRLFKANKIKFVLISGDNSRADYNEPKMMMEDLIKRGIPKEKIFLDYAGFSTLDSVIRCEKVFGEKDLIVVSQKFHNERTIFIADHFGIKMTGYNAKDVSKYFGLKTNIREKFARIKMILDLIFNSEAKFLGKKIKID